MVLTYADVEHIAHLARLELTAVEIETYRQQLTAVLDYANLLNELELTDISPTVHAIPQQNVVRDDVIEPSLPLEDVIYNAPQQQDQQFLIQSVLE